MNHKKLEVWNRSVDLAVEIYEITATFPPEEKYGLTKQMRKSGISIPSNIAEGEGRGSPGDHLQFLGHARGSLYELDTQLVIGGRVGYLNYALIGPRILEVARLLNGTIRYVHEEKRRRQ
jgi:four helix bundle protein